MQCHSVPPSPLTLSIIVPAYNERNTIGELLRRLQAVQFGNDVRTEHIIVDDGSTDGTRETLESFRGQCTVVTHPENRGKGAAIRTGIAHAGGDVLVIQDADLEYDPRDLPSLLHALRDGAHDVVYGSRVLGRPRKAYASYFFHLGGLLVTWWTNVLYGTQLTDEATCYKMFTRHVRDAITLESTGFEFCPEFTGKVLRSGYTIHEVPISYEPRSRIEGKKIRLRDGLVALWTLTKVRLWHRV